MSTALVWLRRNLRVTDNRVLATAIGTHDEVIPAYIWDTYRPLNRCPNRLGFIVESVADLSESVAIAGSKLIVRRGRVQEELAVLAKECTASTVYADTNYEPYELERDEACAKALSAIGIELRYIKDTVLFESTEVRTKEGRPYTVFTPFKRTLLDRLDSASEEAIVPRNLKAPENIRSYSSHTPPDLTALDQSNVSLSRSQLGGSTRAQERWEMFKKGGLKNYRNDRDRLDLDGTSMLSPHIKFGTISVRQLAREALALSKKAEYKEGAETYISELLWREFYYSILTEFPYVATSAFQKKYDGLKWQKNEAYLEAWKAGKTGFPIVDAGMRQLLETGWMHNRARMIVASFLTKDLLINWQEGELHFMWYLTDGDIAQNNGGWQWSASIGTDAQPYYRIFNPYLQSRKFDPNGEYIRRYVPELRSLPNSLIHEPHLMTEFDQAEYQCRLGENYPYPIVDHSKQRDKAKAMFEALKERV